MAGKKQIPLYEIFILALTALWLFSFFGQSLFPDIPHSGGFIYMLAAAIAVLIFLKLAIY